MASLTSANRATQPVTNPRRRPRIMHAGSGGMLLAGLLMAVGSLMPWVSTPVGNLSGMAGPGLWVLCAGVVAIAGALLPYRRVALAHAFIPGAAVATLAAWQLVRIAELSSATDSWGKLLPGIGLVLSAGGAVVLLRTAMRMRAAT